MKGEYMFIHILKYRSSEMRAVKTVVDMLSYDIVPLFEMFKDSYKTRYQVDELTGEFKIKMTIKGRKMRIKIRPNDDINTLDLINDSIKGKKAFVEF